MLNLRTVGKSFSTCLPYQWLFVHLLSLVPSGAHLRPVRTPTFDSSSSAPTDSLLRENYSNFLLSSLLGPADWLALFLPNSNPSIYFSTLMQPTLILTLQNSLAILWLPILFVPGQSVVVVVKSYRRLLFKSTVATARIVPMYILPLFALSLGPSLRGLVCLTVLISMSDISLSLLACTFIVLLT